MNYKQSRDLAWIILDKHKIDRLPVPLSEICKRERIRLVSYTQGAEIIAKLGLREHTIGNDAFSLRRIIFYDDTNPRQRQRFSIAHELGHILLHSPKSATVYNREPSPNDDPIEHEANVFSSRLLAPLCVLHYMGVQSAEDIAKVCDISITAARIRFERLQLIRARDQRIGCFLLSRHEQRVYRRFQKYINASLSNHPIGPTQRQR